MLTELGVGFVVGIPSVGFVSVPGGQVEGGRHGGGQSRDEPVELDRFFRNWTCRRRRHSLLGGGCLEKDNREEVFPGDTWALLEEGTQMEAYSAGGHAGGGFSGGGLVGGGIPEAV